MTPNELAVSKKLAEYRQRNAILKLPEGFVPKLPLMRHQRIGFFYGITLPTCGLFYEQGLGKTCIAINALRYRIEQGQIKKVLVVAPRGVLYSWENEVYKHSNLRPLILHNIIRDKRIDLFREEAEFYLINYEAVSIFYDEIRQLNPDALVLDESTRIKNIKALRTKSVYKIAKNIKYKMCMTGTPITQSPMDAFTQTDILDPNVWGTRNFYQWRYKYFIDKGLAFPIWVPKPGTLDKIKEVMYTIGVRYEKHECLDLPERIYQRQYFELTSEQEKAYSFVEKKLLLELEDNKKVKIQTVLTQIIRLTQIESGFVKSDKVLDDEGNLIEEGEIQNLGNSNPKLNLLEELLDDLLYDNKKVIIWCRFVHSIHLIEKLLKKKKLGYVTYYGQTKDSDRAIAVSSFQEDPSVKVYLSQIHAGGVGITLTAADVAIYYEVDYSLEAYEQSKDRNHRIGSEKWNSITYIFLVCKDLMGEKILAALQDKKDIAKLIMERRKI